MGYTTEWGKCRQYYGMTELLRNQDQQAACDVRLKSHLRQPLPCLASGVPGTFQITALGGKLSLRNCLIQEAINTARALATDDTARGACYSCPKMGSFLRNSARQVLKVAKGLEGQAARSAVDAYSRTLDAGHPLRRHIENQRYKDAAADKQTTSRVIIRLPQRVRSGRSGKPGNFTRKRQLRRKEYPRGGGRHVRLKRGRKPPERREAETAKRVRRS